MLVPSGCLMSSMSTPCSCPVASVSGSPCRRTSASPMLLRTPGSIPLRSPAPSSPVGRTGSKGSRALPSCSSGVSVGRPRNLSSIGPPSFCQHTHHTIRYLVVIPDQDIAGLLHVRVAEDITHILTRCVDEEWLSIVPHHVPVVDRIHVEPVAFPVATYRHHAATSTPSYSICDRVASASEKTYWVCAPGFMCAE